MGSRCSAGAEGGYRTTSHEHVPSDHFARPERQICFVLDFDHRADHPIETLF
jgi:hypothetical protein